MSYRASNAVGEAVRVLRESWWAILACTLLFGIVAAAFDHHASPQYRASTQVSVQFSPAEVTVLGLRPNGQVPVSPAEAGGDLRRPRALRAFRRRVASTPGGGGVVGISGRPGSLIVTGTAGDPRGAANAANAAAAVLVSVQNRRERARLAGVLRTYRSEVRRTRRQLGRGSGLFLEASDLGRQLAAIGLLRRVAAPARVIDPAAPPAKPFFRRGERVPPALLLGLAISLVAAFLVDALATRPRDPRRLASLAGLPLIGRVPRQGGRPLERARLAYRQIEVALPGFTGEGVAEVVLVTSPAPGEGKSTVAVGLAGAAAARGRRACVVECDLRRPVLARRLGLGAPGLTDRLAGGASESGMLRLTTDGQDAPIDVMVAGGWAGTLGEPLESERFADLVGDLRARYDLVLLDSPPVLAVADALGLARLADLVLVCARSGMTTASELEDACEALAAVRPVREGGLVVTAVPAAFSPQAGRRPAVDVKTPEPV